MLLRTRRCVTASEHGVKKIWLIFELSVVRYHRLTGIVGCAGLLPTVEAIKKKKTIALANKETLIAGGPAVLPLLKEHGVDMIPADSEHSAIFQCLQVRESTDRTKTGHCEVLEG